MGDAEKRVQNDVSLFDNDVKAIKKFNTPDFLQFWWMV
jgi:hypothetical protein